MKLVKLFAPLLSLAALAACAVPASPSSSAPQDLYYATPAVAASMSPERIRYAPTTPASSTVTSDMVPFVRTESGFLPASDEEVAATSSTTSPPPVGKQPPHCSLCVYQSDDLTVCGPICCPGQPHCQLYEE